LNNGPGDWEIPRGLDLLKQFRFAAGTGIPLGGVPVAATKATGFFRKKLNLVKSLIRRSG